MHSKVALAPVRCNVAAQPGRSRCEEVVLCRLATLCPASFLGVGFACCSPAASHAPCQSFNAGAGALPRPGSRSPVSLPAGGRADSQRYALDSCIYAAVGLGLLSVRRRACCGQVDAACPPSPSRMLTARNGYSGWQSLAGVCWLPPAARGQQRPQTSCTTHLQSTTCNLERTAAATCSSPGQPDPPCKHASQLLAPCGIYRRFLGIDWVSLLKATAWLGAVGMKPVYVCRIVGPAFYAQYRCGC